MIELLILLLNIVIMIIGVTKGDITLSYMGFLGFYMQGITGHLNILQAKIFNLKLENTLKILEVMNEEKETKE